MNLTKDFIHFLMKITTITALLILAVIVFAYMLPQYYISILPLEILFVAFTTIALHSVLLKAANKSMAVFSRSFLLLTFLKLMLYLMFIAIYLVVKKEQPAVFVGTFFISYMAFTIIETIDLLKISNAKNKQTK